MHATQKKKILLFVNLKKKNTHIIPFGIHRHAQQLVPTAPNELSVANDMNLSTTDTVKFEEKRTMSASKTKVIKDGFSSEQVNFLCPTASYFESDRWHPVIVTIMFSSCK